METWKTSSLTPLAGAVAAALYPASSAVAQEAQDAEVEGERLLEEVIVTATKREVRLQDIPAQIQALTQESLEAIGARSMEDYGRFVPSLNVVTYGSGSSTIVFRGAITGAGWIAQATSSVYLDEISITQVGSQPTIRTVDIERVEALSGPQGTLYGSDAQAGTLRIITNKPVMNEFQTVLDTELRGGGKSDMSYRASLVFNVPLVEDKLAMRLVGFSDRDGGYIDNVYGHTPDWYGLGDRSIAANNQAPAQFGTLDNAASVEKNWNEDEVYGGRIHLRWEINEDWATTASYHNQRADSGGDGAMDVFVGDLQTIRFHDDWREEDFDMGSLVVEGDLGFAELVAAVSYYDREVEAVSDATVYTHYWNARYCHDSYYTLDDYPYYWANPETGYIVWWPVYCHGETVDADYLSAYYIPSKEEKLTAEIRLQGSGDVFDWLVGAYYEDSTDEWLDPYHTPTPGGRVVDTIGASTFAGSPSQQFADFYYGGDWSHTTSNWSAGQRTEWEQTAFFGEFTWHINEKWDVTAGGRYFDRSNSISYWVNQPGRLYPDEGRYANDVFYRQRNNGQPKPRFGGQTEFVPKLSVSYSPNEESMAYVLYSEGVRQGGVNRSRGQPFFPTVYDSDLMKNHELGYRSGFANGAGRLSMTLYHMAWEEYQLQALDPSFVNCRDPDTGEPVLPTVLKIPGVCGQPWQTVIANLGEAHITGFNISVDYAPNEDWVLGFNFEKMEAETDSQHNLDEDPEPEIEKGWRLPLTPDYKAAAWAEFRQPTDWLGASDLFVRLQWSFTGDSVSRLEPLSPEYASTPQWVNPSYNIGDLRAGLVGDTWQVDVFINNLTDERAIYSYDSGPPIKWTAGNLAEGRPHHLDAYVARPREYGVRFLKRWGG